MPIRVIPADYGRRFLVAGCVVLIAAIAGCGGSSEPADTGGGGTDGRSADAQRDTGPVDATDVPSTGMDASDVPTTPTDAARDAPQDDVPQQDAMRSDVSDGCVSSPEVCDGV